MCASRFPSVGVACIVALSLPLAASTAPRTPEPDSGPPGSTRTLSLAPLGTDPSVRGVTARPVKPFSLLGVTWDEAGDELHGTVRVRTRGADTGTWTDWREVQSHTEDTPDGDTGHSRGSTAPLWVGDSDGVEVSVRPEAGRLPAGLRLDMVTPGDTGPRMEQVAHADRPRIVTRAGWSADETIRSPGFVYTDTVSMAFVHHSATGNDYLCEEAPSVIRSIYRYHVESSGWRDMGYNFLVDKCGTIYEGRAGGVAEPVLGAHTLGFNGNSMGIAVLGTHTETPPTAEVLNGVAKLAAWKLGLFGVNPLGTVDMSAGINSKYKKGAKVKMQAISGHRDGFNTECPGALLYEQLDAVRRAAADLQGG